MAKLKMIIIRVTSEQEQILLAKTQAAGFTKKAHYVRSVLFMPLSSEEKIDQIYRKVCKDGK